MLIRNKPDVTYLHCTDTDSSQEGQVNYFPCVFENMVKNFNRNNED